MDEGLPHPEIICSRRWAGGDDPLPNIVREWGPRPCASPLPPSHSLPALSLLAFAAVVFTGITIDGCKAKAAEAGEGSCVVKPVRKPFNILIYGDSITEGVRHSRARIMMHLQRRVCRTSNP